MKNKYSLIIIQMKKGHCLILLYFLVVISGIGCSEFLEESIDKETVYLFSPGKEAILESPDVIFRWEKVGFALKYQLQIARPNFDSIVYVLADSITSSTHFSITLTPGNFEWRVRAMNGSSQSIYSSQKFSIPPSKPSEPKKK